LALELEILPGTKVGIQGALVPFLKKEDGRVPKDWLQPYIDRYQVRRKTLNAAELNNLAYAYACLDDNPKFDDAEQVLDAALLRGQNAGDTATAEVISRNLAVLQKFDDPTPIEHLPKWPVLSLTARAIEHLRALGPEIGLVRRLSKRELQRLKTLQ
jgi:hypothetical protein